MSRQLPENGRLPRALYRAEQVRALDRAAIEQEGVSGAQLMERAGAAAFALLRARWPAARSIVVLAGAGNNGGDGYVLARIAHQHKLAVRLLSLGDHGRLRGAAAEAAREYADADGAVETFERLPPDAEVIVDAMLGTGLERPLEGLWAEAVRQCNASRRAVVAIDIPTGLHADTGRVLGCAVEADATISFIGLKQGLFTGRGPDHCGDVCFDALRVPAVVYATEVLSARRVDWAMESERLPRRRPSANKGDFGHVLVVGGAPGMSGAPRLSAAAALRTGAGLVTVATHPDHAALLNLSFPELMVRAVDDAQALLQTAAHATVLALGPGLGQGGWGHALFAAALSVECPVVVDADGLNLLAQSPQRRDDWVLTPHPGEAARLLQTTVEEVEADRFGAVKRLQQRYGGVVVLKGAGTLVQGPGLRPTAVCTDGNPGMATGGMGDALTGIIAALLAQGMDGEGAATLGVCLHGAAGDYAAAAGGERGLIASDLIAAVRPVLDTAERAQ